MLRLLTSEQDAHTQVGAVRVDGSLVPYLALLSEKHHAQLAEASGTATITLDGLGNTIDDAEFFPDLPGLVNGVADRLTRLMDLDKRLISALHKACTACPMLLAFHDCCHAVVEALHSHGNMARLPALTKLTLLLGLCRRLCLC